jgi:hypothetical protein
MYCEYCKNVCLIEGTLEGVSFMPLSEKKRWIKTGIYGIKTMVCPVCGRFSNFRSDNESIAYLKKITERESGGNPGTP